MEQYESSERLGYQSRCSEFDIYDKSLRRNTIEVVNKKFVVKNEQIRNFLGRKNQKIINQSIIVESSKVKTNHNCH